MFRIIISYKRVDKDKVFKIKDQIESALGEKCWIDLDSIESDNFARQTLKAIDDATIILFFYSSDSESSQWQRRELEYAIKNGKKVVLLQVEKIPRDSWCHSYCDKYPIFIIDEEFDIEQVLVAITGNHIKKNKSLKKAMIIIFMLFSFLIVIISTYYIYYGNILCAPSQRHLSIKEISELYYNRCKGDTIRMDTIFVLNSYLNNLETLSPYEQNLKNEEDLRLAYSSLICIAWCESDCKYVINSRTIKDSLTQKIDSIESFNDLYEFEHEYLQVLTHKEDVVLDNVGRQTEAKNNNIYLFVFLLLLLFVLTFYIYTRRRTTNLPMFKKTKYIKVFIAGSTRLVAERDALRATISKMYNQHKNENLVIEAYEFDDFSREYVEGGQQKMYDNFIRNEANWVVFITDGTMGDKTIWELENAIQAHKDTGRPKILMYSIPQNVVDVQKEQMSQFKSILNREDNYWIDYEDVNTIRSTFREHLEWDLINLMKQELRRIC